jgi:hypothetical protein
MATMDSIPISFNWTNLDELDLSLSSLKIAGSPKATIAVKHCDVLRDSQECLSANDIAVFNAAELAEGYADFAVLLLEPADMEEEELHAERIPRTIECVSEELLGSCQTRDWHNTCIVDIRPFRSNQRRMHDNAEMRESKDDLAYNVTKRMLNMLEPDVLLLCQSATSSCSNRFA